eukprot:gene3079-6037_t
MSDINFQSYCGQCLTVIPELHGLVLSCGDFLCDECGISSTDRCPVCGICGIRSATLSTPPVEVSALLSDPSSLLQGVYEALKFQIKHYQQIIHRSQEQNLDLHKNLSMMKRESSVLSAAKRPRTMGGTDSWEQEHEHEHDEQQYLKPIIPLPLSSTSNMGRNLLRSNQLETTSRIRPSSAKSNYSQSQSMSQQSESMSQYRSHGFLPSQSQSSSTPVHQRLEQDTNRVNRIHGTGTGNGTGTGDSSSRYNEEEDNDDVDHHRQRLTSRRSSPTPSDTDSVITATGSVSGSHMGPGSGPQSLSRNGRGTESAAVSSSSASRRFNYKLTEVASSRPSTPASTSTSTSNINNNSNNNNNNSNNNNNNNNSQFSRPYSASSQRNTVSTPSRLRSPHLPYPRSATAPGKAVSLSQQDLQDKMQGSGLGQGQGQLPRRGTSPSVGSLNNVTPRRWT